MTKGLFLLIIVKVFFYQSLGGIIFSAEPKVEEDKILRPVRASVPPKIDGSLDDEVWQSPPLAKEFITYHPVYGEVLSQKTVVWLAYDSKNLYFAFHCYDSEPQKIKTSITKRDNIFPDDWLCLVLDCLGNKQVAYEFFVNPKGIQQDAMITAIGGEHEDDLSPDWVWDSAGQLTDDGYQLEIGIPLRSIRFKSGQEVKMGIFIARHISRLGVEGSWPDLKPGVGIFNQMLTVVYRDLKSPLNLELLPSFTYGRNNERENLDSWGETETFNDIGIGIKYGITSSVTADLTVNPDFSQVESDAFQAEVNRRYPIFYSEKRPFFMEGIDILDFVVIPHGNMYTAVHTRRIVDPNWGAKLTGTLGKTAFGIVAAGDQWPGLAWDDEVNPFEGKTAYFTIARGKYSLGGENYIGGLYSGREFADGYNRVAGGDLMYRFLEHHRASFSFLQSYSGESEGGPGTSGSALNCFYTYFTKPLDIMAAYERYGTDFRMDSAFYHRIGISSGKIWIGPSFYPDPQKVSWLKRINPSFLAIYLHDFTTNMDDRFLRLSVHLNFIKQGYLALYYILESESWVNQTFDKTIIELIGGVQITNWLRLGGSLERGDRIYYHPVNPYLGWGSSGSIDFTLQPSTKLNQYFEFYHTDFYRSSDDQKIYQVNIFNTRTTYQFNKYLFVRAIFQYNNYQNKLLTDLLGSFTFIPGTVIHLGYGSLYERRDWQQDRWVYGLGNMLNIRRSLFFKASYLWRF